VLVPLFREAGVIPDLVRALDALDYPRTKLEVLLLIESIDLETQAALLALQLPPHFRIVHVPDCFPRTKPKALNYALAFARGDLVVVYDAEDRPQPSQLRLAADVFSRAPADVVCLQARLNIYNPGESWFARQFTIEYSALFDAVLPALASLRLPIPLGGTSNHFRRAALIDLQGWDPFNVTEDADLGIRLARNGYRTLVLPSTTWEEAPVAFPVWLRQRTRWIKGWMQTLLVHTREPSALRRDLGLLGAVGVHAVLGGLVFSALAQPWFLMLVAYQVSSGEFFAPPETLWSALMISICWANLTIGYVVSVIVGFLSTWRRGRKRLALEALMMPAYWLLISLAAHRALYQLVREPYLWEKTPHGVSRRKSRMRRPLPA
jgi:cellulose synthase/poly-beta-1,6-N-acetylglucosamine synthase-like glycosyltransferase